MFLGYLFDIMCNTGEINRLMEKILPMELNLKPREASNEKTTTFLLFHETIFHTSSTDHCGNGRLRPRAQSLGNSY